MVDLNIIKNKDGIFFEVKVIPRSSREEIVGILDGKLKVKLTTPPVDGKANNALIQLLAQELSISRNDIQIVRGATSTLKQVFVRHIDKADITKICPTPR
ncbi:MAG: DUF167 domain-containing protein [Candidatus Auribacterota bacterium]|jgi:uncharacterized protein (TIGR00251 family)|uniref:UPF0235 protein C4541_00335 n=1 Tax=Candidatus Auribacter fodinae TaxID=2093366 RepID=A0A3A4R9W4_9BACT|nr:MAG: YggU family protein [Candidatus Auribacter fodinae]